MIPVGRFRRQCGAGRWTSDSIGRSIAHTSRIGPLAQKMSQTHSLCGSRIQCAPCARGAGPLFEQQALTDIRFDGMESGMEFLEKVSQLARLFRTADLF